MDLVELLVRVAGWVYWLAWAVALGSAGASFLFMALGDRDRAATLFKGSIAAILVATFGQTILLSVIGVLGGWQEWSTLAGQVTRYPEAGTVVYVLAFTLLLLAAVNLARGHVAEGGWMIIGAVLALALVVFAAQAFNTTVMAYGGGPLLVEARTDRLFYKPDEGVRLYVTVRASGLAVDKVNVTVDWGDGTRSERVVRVGVETMICAPPPTWIPPEAQTGTACYEKYYSVRGEDAKRGVFYTIKVNAAYKNLLSGSTAVTVYVRELPGLSFPFSTLGGLMNMLLGMLTGGMLDPTRLLYSPVFRLDGPEGAWYNRALTLAVMVLPVFMLFRIAPGLAFEPGRAIVEGFRDAALAVVAMVLIPHAYNVTAGVLNLFTDGLAGQAGSSIIAQMAGTATAYGATFVLISLVSPGAGFLGGTLLLTVLLISMLGVLRWFIVLAAVAASPLLVLAWLHPALRGAANQFYGIVGAIMLAGPLAAVFVNLFAEAVLGDDIFQSLTGSFALSWAGVFVVGLLPQVISLLAVTGAERLIAMKLEQTAIRGAPQVGKAILAGGARGLAAGATMAGTAAYAQAVKVKPIADVMRAAGVMIGRARETLSRAVTSLQKGLEGRMARDEARYAGAVARHSTLTTLKKGFQELHELDQRTESTYSRLADLLQYYDELSPDEQRDPEKMLPMVLARMEYDALVEARAEKEEQLRDQLREHYEKNLIKGDELRNLKNLLRTPQLGIGVLEKMIEEQTHEVQMRKAELERDKAIHGRFARLIEGVRGTPARLRKLVSGFFTVPRERRKGDLEILKLEEGA